MATSLSTALVPSLDMALSCPTMATTIFSSTSASIVSSVNSLAGGYERSAETAMLREETMQASSCASVGGGMAHCCGMAVMDCTSRVGPFYFPMGHTSSSSHGFAATVSMGPT